MDDKPLLCILHSQMELLMSFVESVVLKAIHDSESTDRQNSFQIFLQSRSNDAIYGRLTDSL
jgi:hypothetical protein